MLVPKSALLKMRRLVVPGFDICAVLGWALGADEYALLMDLCGAGR